MTLTVFHCFKDWRKSFGQEYRRVERGGGRFGIKCSKITPELPNFFWPLIKAVMPTLQKLTSLALNLKLLCHGSFKRSLWEAPLVCGLGPVGTLTMKGGTTTTFNRKNERAKEREWRSRGRSGRTSSKWKIYHGCATKKRIKFRLVWIICEEIGLLVLKHLQDNVRHLME